MTKKIMLDANFLIDIFRFRIDLDLLDNLIEDSFSFETTSSVKKELLKISKRSSKEGSFAKLALKIIEIKKVNIIKSKEFSGDASILENISKETMVATIDLKLRKTLKRLGIKTIYLRSKKRLEIG